MFDPISVTLGGVVEGVVGVLAGTATEMLKSKLRSDPARNAFQQALGAAIQHYAITGTRLTLALPLLKKDGPLSEALVAEELAQILRFERKPNAKLIGDRWKATVENPPQWRDFTYEAELLMSYLETELRGSEVFRPIFDSKSLDAIAVSTAVSASTLAEVEGQLVALTELMQARFGELMRTFAGASSTIQEQIRDYTPLIEDRTRDFIGRQFALDSVERFTEGNRRGYFFVRGDPGIGKTALVAQMVKTQGYVHHFNVRAEGINKTETFLRNVCAQLIAAYKLEHTFLPPEAVHDAGFLNRLLTEVSGSLVYGEKAILVIDALDEVDNRDISPGGNTLYLPVSLPLKVYIIATTRRVPIGLRLECEHDTLDIEPYSSSNIADVNTYVWRWVKKPGIKAYIAAQKINTEYFMENLVQKSEGNFMYLRCVLPEIERGIFRGLELKNIPSGLQNYYEDHWQRMRGDDKEAWYRYKLPIIMALTVVEEPVSINLMADFSGVQELPRIRTVLQEWGQFLHTEYIEYEGGWQKRYSLYHSSFHDFIASKEEVADERVSRTEARKKMEDKLWSGLLNDE